MELFNWETILVFGIIYTLILIGVLRFMSVANDGEIDYEMLEKLNQSQTRSDYKDHL